MLNSWEIEVKFSVRYKVHYHDLYKTDKKCTEEFNALWQVKSKYVDKVKQAWFYI